MPRKSNIKEPGVRKYGTITNYTKEMLNEAIEKIRSGALSQRKACKFYNIPRSTINLKLKNKHMKPVGRPTCLTMEEEVIFRDHLLALSDMGIPIGLQDFRDVVKRYLDNIGKTVPVFKDNSPGYEWAKLYMERNPAIKEKIAHNISRKRAQVNEDMVNEFFDRLEKEVEGVDPDNIYNMDESGFHDDPGKKKLLFRRSTRHPELVKNSSKSCFTIVFAGNAIGDFIPPFFIFKGKHCWSDWLVNAPKSSKMAVSKSGWIDADIFEEWLEKHFVPIVDKREGKKILICDNLSAHISVKALKICLEHNIKFICLIPNSTHLLQPLDVGYFSSSKSAWHTVLNKWRQTQRGRKSGALPKNVFCQLVNSALQLNESTAGLNMVAGFKKCGIYPCSRIEVLQVLPSYATGQIQATIGETFKEYLQEIRASDLNIKTTRKFQLPVAAGKAISAEEVENFYNNRQEQQAKKKEKPVKKGRPKGSKNKKTIKKSEIEKGVTPEVGGQIQGIINETEKTQFYNHEPECEASQTESFQLIVATAQVHNERKSPTSEMDRIEEWVVDDIPPIPEIAAEVTIATPTAISRNKRKKPTISTEQNKRVMEIDIIKDDIQLETIIEDYIVNPSGNLVKTAQEERYEVGKFCVFQDEGSLFPGRITKICQTPYSVWLNTLNKRFEGGWTWPTNPYVTKITDSKMLKKVIADENISHNRSVIYIQDDFLCLEWGE